MVTQASGETVTGKKRGRPSKQAQVPIKVPQAKEGERGTDFQRLTKAHMKDTIVRAFVNLRRRLFVEGEPVDVMTNSIKKRISDLQSKTNTLH